MAARAPSMPAALGERLTLTTWNLGYAGLGADSDFITDGGKHRFPPSRRSVRRNLAEIVRTLGSLPSDLYLLQEVSDFSPLSWWVPMRAELERALGGKWLEFRQDVGTTGTPPPLRIVHGKMTAAAARPLVTEVLPLPTPAQKRWRFRQFGIVVTRFAAADSLSHWVIGNLHLSAFDEGGRLRQEQLDAVLAFARREYESGNRVVLGGDWNMVLSDPHYPTRTDEKYLFWIVDFPHHKLPEGWSMAFHDGVPTVRTLHQRYVPGDNYVTTIDGFLLSPNVALERVATTDTQFGPSDHMPVTAVVRGV